MVPEENVEDEELHRQVVEQIETTLEMHTDDLEIEVEDGFVSIWGGVPSMKAHEELEHLLFDILGLEDVDFDVVVNEDLQTQEETLSSASSADDFNYGQDDSGFGGLNESPRRQF
ncbi:MAG: hypothetical protein ACQEP7_07580 [bacterium]